MLVVCYNVILQSTFISILVVHAVLILLDCDWYHTHTNASLLWQHTHGQGCHTTHATVLLTRLCTYHSYDTVQGMHMVWLGNNLVSVGAWATNTIARCHVMST